ncbi:hypothetical protein KSS87_005066 [Heliosperma pusillum]|nr:hypothetical protein KSS87_005066 [Heliosperma pusillum]
MCLMENRNCHVLNACIHKDHEASSMEMNDRLSELPNDLILSILSHLTTKEVRRTSVISKKWRRWLLGYYPKLNFQGSREIVRIWFEIRNNDEELTKQKSNFISEVDHVMEQHLDSAIDHFRVVFDLDTSWQSRIDHWVALALRKRVKTLELDFQPVYDRMDTHLNRGGLFIDYSNPQGIVHSLASLSLNYVNITSEVVDNILLSCPVLENLYIRQSIFLTSIKSQSSSLKHLDVSYCEELHTIDISAPKMVLFRYFGQPITLNVRNAVSLSSLFIGGGPGEDITYAFEPMSKYFSQLEALCLELNLGCFTYPWNIGVEHLQLPLFSTLKMLELCIRGCNSLSLRGWTPLIEACPVLENLTVKFKGIDSGLNWVITKRSGSPLKCLKTLKLFGYCGRRADIEFATFVIENAINLQEVFVEVKIVAPPKVSVYVYDPIRINELKEIIPEGVRVILTESVKCY